MYPLAKNRKNTSYKSYKNINIENQYFMFKNTSISVGACRNL